MAYLLAAHSSLYGDSDVKRPVVGEPLASCKSRRRAVLFPMQICFTIELVSDYC